ncbi:MAG: hypothetical protein BWZ01_03067 [Deltaproteobacteria bacterium ADurb.BinA179]|jgi:hypothetical protein|nr:MAG: hypothetical protein BWZ01_03067 [Deltaproteobacteria bacterium ADurb.BinA179]
MILSGGCFALSYGIKRGPEIHPELLLFLALW